MFKRMISNAFVIPVMPNAIRGKNAWRFQEFVRMNMVMILFDPSRAANTDY